MTTRLPAAAKAVSTAALALTAAGLLAACSSAAGEQGASSDPASSGGNTSSAAPEDAAPSEDSGSAAGAGPYADANGEYSATGRYQTPGGPEEVDVTLTLADGVVEAVEVEGSGGTANANRYQSAFISGVDAQVVGKSIDGLQVGAVSGSSLTPKGFNAAVEQIRSELA